MLEEAKARSGDLTPEEKDRIMWTVGSLYTGRCVYHCGLSHLRPFYKMHSGCGHGEQPEALCSDMGAYCFRQTLSTLQVFILLMTIHQDVQMKLQEEIEKITGGARLPELSDMESMPYVRCVMLELLRWQSVSPLGQ